MIYKENEKSLLEMVSFIPSSYQYFADNTDLLNRSACDLTREMQDLYNAAAAFKQEKQSFDDFKKCLENVTLKELFQIEIIDQDNDKVSDLQKYIVYASVINNYSQKQVENFAKDIYSALVQSKAVVDQLLNSDEHANNKYSTSLDVFDQPPKDLQTEPENQ